VGIDYVRMAYAHRLTQETDKALELVDEALSREPQHTQALMLRGLLQSDAGDHEAAVSDFRKVLQAVPDHKEAAHKLARSLIRLGRSNEAKRYLRRSQELHRESVKGSAAF